MSEREQFEAAMCQLAEQPESSFEKPYDSDDVNAHWAVWQASRRAALDDAGAFMDARADELAACGNHTADTMARIYRVEAASIRALVEKEQP
jgi:hypothetical protein